MSSCASSRYAAAPRHVGSYCVTGLPWLGATETHVARDERLEQLVRVRPAHLRQHVPRECRARVTLRHEDAAALELRIQLRAHELLRVEKVAQPLEGEKLAL